LIKLRSLLQLQILYALMGIAYNGVSFYYAMVLKQPLSSTSPVLGTITMTIYALFLIPGFLGKITFYRILMLVAILVIGWGGIVTHIINIFTQPQLYYSLVAWAIAVGINVFGLVLNIIAALGKFKR
jgi:hypothetical protein